METQSATTSDARLGKHGKGFPKKNNSSKKEKDKHETLHTRHMGF